MDVLVVGGTGTAGRQTVHELARRGHDVRALSRHAGAAPEAGVRYVQGDVITGQGLADALAGVDTVVDVSNIGTQNGQRARAFFVGGTRRLIASEAAGGVRHHVLLSIVGVDRVPTGYFKAKLAQEQALIEAADAAGVGWSILRAAQLHDFAAQYAVMGRHGPVVLVPRTTVRPVATQDVAAVLADSVERGPCGRLPVLAGPAPMRLPDMVRALLRRRGAGGFVVAFPVPGRAASGLVPPPGEPACYGRRTFGEWLQGQPRPAEVG